MRSYLVRYLVACLIACAMTMFIAQSDVFGNDRRAFGNDRRALGREYDATGTQAVDAKYEVWRDVARQRELPVKVVAPGQLQANTPVIVHSHGLGGSVEGGNTWSEHWASHGYIVIHVQHPGSDESIWKTKTGVQERVKAFKQAANADNLILRLQDVSFVIDEMERRKTAGATVWKQADLSRIGMSGHSFGARTTLGICGQTVPVRRGAMKADPRVKGCIAFSPNANARIGPLDQQFGSIKVPVLSLTGSLDADVIGDGTKAEDRMLPYENMPGPNKYLAWFDGGDHAVFGGGGGRRDNQRASTRDAEIQRDVRALTLAFWDAYLQDDKAAREWLKRDAARILAQNDIFKSK
jgi:predicted dienelactone hydrolase